MPVDDHTPPEATLKTAGTLIDHMLDRLGLARADVIGVGVAMPGPIQRRTGRQRPRHHAQAVGQRQPAAAAAEVLCSCPSIVGNDANFAALAEITWGAARGLRDFAYVYTASGIGAGFILNGALYLGANGTAGELGHTTIDENGAGLRVRRPRLPQHPGQRRRDHARTCGAATATGCPSPTSSSSPRWATSGAAASSPTRAGTSASPTANMYNLLDPELIILGGNLAPAGEILLGPLRESMARRAIHAGEVLPPVVVGDLDGDIVVVLGAAAAVLRDAARFPLPMQRR